MAQLFLPTLHTFAMKNLFTGSRREVREQAVETALRLLLECLQ